MINKENIHKKTFNIRYKNKNTNKKTMKKRTFSKEDYNAPDGFQTSTWGPATWHFMHTISFNYPVNPSYQDKVNYRNFILNLQYVLPCKYCRINLKTNFKQLPITMETMKNRESFSKYIYELHELVNKMLKKKSNLTYYDVRERYEFFRSRCLDERKNFKKCKQEKVVKKEKGCTEPLHGKKTKCIIRVVPHDDINDSFQIDKKCNKI
jgi:hypothetical protein